MGAGGRAQCALSPCLPAYLPACATTHAPPHAGHPSNRRRRLAPRRRPAGSPYTSPILPPPELGTPVAERSPAGSLQSEAAGAAAPRSRSSSPPARPPLPRPPSAPALAKAAAQSLRSASPQPPRPRVRDLVRAWTSFGGRGSVGEAAAAATAAAVDLPRTDLEAQQQQQPQGPPCHQAPAAAEARALTWSQMGLSPMPSPTASRRPSENASAHGLRQPTQPAAVPQGEVHANPVFCAFDWAAPPAGAAEAGAAGSFSHGQVRRTASRSRLSRAVSFADPAADGCGSEGSTHGAWEGSGRSPTHSRRGSFLHGGAAPAAHSGGAQMPSRPSEQSLLRLQAELDRIAE